MSDEMTAWLRKQIESDLALARRVASRYVVALDSGSPRAGQPFWPTPGAESGFRRWKDPDILAGLDLVKAFGPQWIIDDCEAKLAILDEHPSNDYEIYPECARCAVEAFPCRTVRLLASAYRRRPGYSEEWAA